LSAELDALLRRALDEIGETASGEADMPHADRIANRAQLREFLEKV